jgi:hypothetical protein
LITKELPTKLCNVEKWEVELTENQKGKYAIVSYVWGEQKEAVDNVWNRFQYWNKSLNISGNKALYKTTETCKLLDINYFWIDQLCINQDNPTEKAQEVSKMRQYYSNASFTLISINTELGDITNTDLMDILKKIINSEWFTRSWTYQEGWLSKHTIFMFDDKLIDGRAMAGTWALNQLGYANEGRYNSRTEFNKGTKKIATPVGWTYYRDGYDEDDRVTLTLNQALKEVKKRGRSVPIDGIYSILGLLPYGEHVKVKYNKNNKYTKDELNDALYEVMKVATGYRTKIEPVNYYIPKDDGLKIGKETLKKTLSDGRKVVEYPLMEGNHYAEPLAWHGVSNKGYGLSWMPEIYADGSTSVEGGIDVRCSGEDCFAEEKSLELFSTIYTIHKINPTIQKLEGGFEIESGLYQKEVEVKPEIKKKIGESYKEFEERKEEAEKPISIFLLGTQATLEAVQKNNIIAVPSGWISKKPFALLLEDTGEVKKVREPCGWGEKEYSIYHRLGLVELGNSEKLKGANSKRIIIASKPQKQYQNQIEIQNTT